MYYVVVSSLVLGFAVYSVWDRRKQKKLDEGDSLGSSASQKQLWGGGKERNREREGEGDCC